MIPLTSYGKVCGAVQCDNSFQVGRSMTGWIDVVEEGKAAEAQDFPLDYSQHTLCCSCGLSYLRFFYTQSVANRWVCVDSNGRRLIPRTDWVTERESKPEVRRPKERKVGISTWDQHLIPNQSSPMQLNYSLSVTQSAYILSFQN
jgi:hypothetical protein